MKEDGKKRIKNLSEHYATVHPKEELSKLI
jgi:hypothetical protein